MKRTVLMALVVAAAAAVFATRAQHVFDARIDKRLALVEPAKQAVRNSLKDPGSAQWQLLRVTSRGAVCGFVNSRNSYGAYAGVQSFFVPPPGIVAYFDDTSSRGTYAQWCDSPAAGDVYFVELLENNAGFIPGVVVVAIAIGLLTTIGLWPRAPRPTART
jgi:hypothetical protein